MYMTSKFKTPRNDNDPPLQIATAVIASDIMKFLIDNELDSDVMIYYNKHPNSKEHESWYRIRTDNYNLDEKQYATINTVARTHKYTWYEEQDKDPNDYFEYNGNYLSMSFEGPLYRVLNCYDIPSDYDRRVCTAIRNYLSHYGLYYEFGNAWNLSLFKV